MPKTLILLLADDPALLARARRVADGARAVRFAEVDVRPWPGVLDDDYRSSASAPLTAADYDAVVLGATGTRDDAAAALAAFDPGRALADKVGAAFAGGGGNDGACWAALQALAAHGLLLVPPAAAGDALGDAASGDERDRALGRRVATVAGWVRHARGHEHGHGHAHSH